MARLSDVYYKVGIPPAVFERGMDAIFGFCYERLHFAERPHASLRLLGYKTEPDATGNHEATLVEIPRPHTTRSRREAVECWCNPKIEHVDA